MQWTKPDFEVINLSMEVTAYVNTDDEVRTSEQSLARPEPLPVSAGRLQEASA